MPYGNNAKSADLAGGTTTVSMDGGNSIAIKGSKFSASTGDAGGDKKGVASGTIEAEAEFISASPTVKFEGIGVCRLSDQMTMNKANTMCLGGAQNPSVSVTEDQEGTYTVDLKVTYDDGTGFQAPYKLVDSAGASFEGVLDEKGEANVSGITRGTFQIEYGEDIRDFQPDKKYVNTNPYYKNTFDPHELIESTKIGQVGFWEAAKNQSSTVGSWLWGFIVGDFNKDPTTGQIMLNTLLGVVPGIDQVLDARDITANILFLSEEENQNNQEAWLDLALSGIGAIPTLGSVLKGVGKAVKSDKSRDDVFALVREYGKGDVDKFLTNLDWNVIKYEVLQIISEAILSFSDVLDELAKKASFFGYDEYALEIGNFKSQVEAVEKQAHQHIPDALMFLKDKVDMSLRRGKSKSNAGSQSDKGSAEAGTHDDKVSQEKKEKKPDECWLCEKKIGKKKTEKPSATYCDQNGFKGKHHKKTDDEYGFTGRGTSGNGHYPWLKLKAHNNRKNASSMQHPLYTRCYDRDLNGKYVRPQQIWDKKEGLDAFQELKTLGITDKDKMEGLEKNLQAHHIITVNEMENNDFLFKKLPYLGYNLNDWYNIVVLPGIPELACFYEMPLHSGSHPTAYTDNVKRRLSSLRNAILGSKYCNENDSKALELIVKEMKQHSLDVYKQITQFRRMGALNHSNYDVYKKGNKGCCNKLKHSDIENDSTPCRHRTLSKMDASSHHDFRTTKGGIPARIPYAGVVISKLGY
ncbi:PAAR-like domain-containing protein [Vibrio lentus]|uniref:PAAR-like domain-containing protein n=1 Tax=Vibrio lentus TaxID=136468 RepID=UPI0039AEA761